MTCNELLQLNVSWSFFQLCGNVECDVWTVCRHDVDGGRPPRLLSSPLVVMVVEVLAVCDSSCIFCRCVWRCSVFLHMRLSGGGLFFCQ